LNAGLAPFVDTLMMTVIAASLLAVGAGCGLPDAGGAPWRTGETLTFQVGIPNAPGNATATIRAEGDGDRLLLRGEAGLDAPLGIYRVRGSARSWVDAETLRPLSYADEVVDRAGRGTSAATFGRGPAVRIDWTDGKRRGVNAFVRQRDVLDALSALYYLRAVDLRAGAPLCFDLVGGRRAWRVSGTVGGMERIETPAGRFLAVRIGGRAVRTDRPRDVSRLQLWVSADARRLPVKATVETDTGTVRALLARAATQAGQR